MLVATRINIFLSRGLRFFVHRSCLYQPVIVLLNLARAQVDGYHRLVARRVAVPFFPLFCRCFWPVLVIIFQSFQGRKTPYPHGRHQKARKLSYNGLLMTVRLSHKYFTSGNERIGEMLYKRVLRR